MATFDQHLLIEARKNNWESDEESPVDFLSRLKDRGDIFIQFTNIEKHGLNPKSSSILSGGGNSLNTPLGIYTYPLKEIWYDLKENKIPFASDRKFINVLVNTKNSEDSTIRLSEVDEEFTNKTLNKLLQNAKQKYGEVSDASIKLMLQDLNNSSIIFSRDSADNSGVNAETLLPVCKFWAYLNTVDAYYHLISKQKEYQETIKNNDVNAYKEALALVKRRQANNKLLDNTLFVRGWETIVNHNQEYIDRGTPIDTVLAIGKEKAYDIILDEFDKPFYKKTTNPDEIIRVAGAIKEFASNMLYYYKDFYAHKPNSFDAYKEQILTSDFDEQLRSKNPSKISKYKTHHARHSVVALGIHTIIDDAGYGIIHSKEPTQAVTFVKQDLKLAKTLNNINPSKSSDTRSQLVGDLVFYYATDVFDMGQVHNNIDLSLAKDNVSISLRLDSSEYNVIPEQWDGAVRQAFKSPVEFEISKSGNDWNTSFYYAASKNRGKVNLREEMIACYKMFNALSQFITPSEYRKDGAAQKEHFNQLIRQFKEKQKHMI